MPPGITEESTEKPLVCLQREAQKQFRFQPLSLTAMAAQWAPQQLLQFEGLVYLHHVSGFQRSLRCQPQPCGNRAWPAALPCPRRCPAWGWPPGQKAGLTGWAQPRSANAGPQWPGGGRRGRGLEKVLESAFIDLRRVRGVEDPHIWPNVPGVFVK